VVGVVAAVALLVLAAPAFTARQGDQLRRIDTASYPLVQLVVRTDGAAAPRIYENGVRVAGVQAQNLGQSKAIVLAIDRSTSMAGAPLAQAGRAAERFLARKRQSDYVSVVTFGSTAIAQSTLGQATIDADTALRGLSSDTRQGTALYDAVVVASSELDAQSLPGRVLVLLTDGRNVRSVATLAQALAAARKAGVVAYAIALGHAYSFPLRLLANDTGGKFYSSPTPTALDSIYRQITGELDRTWRVSYATTARPGDRISISVGRPGAAARTVVLPGHRSRPGHTFVPRAVLGSFGWTVALAAIVGVLAFLGLRQLQLLPRAARAKRLVWAHTDPRGQMRVRAPRRRRPTLATLFATIDRRLRGRRRWSRIEQLVETAGVPVAPAAVPVVAAALALVLAILLGLATGSTFIALVGLAAGAATPFVFLRIRAARRIRAFESQLPEVLATVASSLRVGHGLKASLQAIADEGVAPTGVELRRVLAEARLGRPLEEALVAMCERLGSDDLQYVATAVDIQSQIGGSLAGVFTTVAETVRQRQHHRARVHALTATGRASAVVLSLLPFGMAIVLTLMNPGYMLPFLRSDTGHVLIAYSIVSISIGAFLLSRIASVKG
jgi:tight adherence protein B